MRYDYKMTSELTHSEIQSILYVLNNAFEGWGDETFFHWKYVENPHGESLHMIGYDKDEPIATVGFWRNGPDDLPAYQCVDAAVSPSHQRRGIYQTALNGCSERLEGAYIYTFTSDYSRPAMMRCGWHLKWKIPMKFQWASVVLRRYEKIPPISDEYAEWRFAKNPKGKKYYICRRKGVTFVLSKRREHIYAAGGVLSKDFGLPEVRPRVLFSFDFPDLPFLMPRPNYYFIENPCHLSYEHYIASYYSDTF